MIVEQRHAVAVLVVAEADGDHTRTGALHDAVAADAYPQQVGLDVPRTSPVTRVCRGPLSAAETRFVVYDLVFATADGARKDKLVLISWCSEGAEAAQRIAHSTTRNKLRNLLDGSQVQVQTTNLSDLEYDELVSRTS
ncbi:MULTISPECIES: hypothetical protein [unclassified Streptomyces]|uniref:hypothetical protein n=1 Tax=unclassified Streptomyces TaxID=2593676 RepID=UPI002E80DEF4|nr:hypothetical protein [Streptomyces sp. NBC_00562]WUC25028.1 hypothetical protein OHA33_43525 [Streptomyces sp. NBC_00562]